MTAKGSVSVVVPARNAGLWINASVRSVLEQTSGPLEVIVVDDGSTDGTAAAVSVIADERVKLIPGPEQGAAAARTRGCEVASGEWLAFCDADDLWTAGKLEAQLAAALADGLSLVGTDCSLLDGDEPLPVTMADLHPRSRAMLTVTDLLNHNPLATSSVIVRRDELIAAGGFRRGFEPAEDWHLWLRLVAAGARARVLPEALTTYRLHDQSASASQLHMHEAELRVVDDLLQTSLSPEQIFEFRHRRRGIQASILRESRGETCSRGDYVRRIARAAKLGKPRVIVGEVAFAIAPELFARKRPRLSARQAIMRSIEARQ